MSADELTMLSEVGESLFAGVRLDDEDLPRRSWGLLRESGMTGVSAPEPFGDAQPLDFLMTLLRVAGRATVSVPLLDTHVAATLSAAADLPADLGCGLEPAAAVAVAYAPELLRLPARPQVGRGRPMVLGAVDVVNAVLCVRPNRDGTVTLLTWATADLGLTIGRSVAGEAIALFDPRDRHPAPAATAGCPPEDARRAGLTLLLGQAVQMVGAAEQALEQTLRYVSEREQFGRTLSKFQAVQHTVATMSSLVASAAAAAAAATASLADAQDVSDPQPLFDVLAARAQAARMAARVVRSAHQLHGAIGFTEEHSLRFATTRLSAWRSALVSEADLDVALGELTLRVGDPWPLVAVP